MDNVTSVCSDRRRCIYVKIGNWRKVAIIIIQGSILKLIVTPHACVRNRTRTCSPTSIIIERKVECCSGILCFFVKMFHHLLIGQHFNVGDTVRGRLDRIYNHETSKGLHHNVQIAVVQHFVVRYLHESSDQWSIGPLLQTIVIFIPIGTLWKIDVAKVPWPRRRHTSHQHIGIIRICHVHNVLKARKLSPVSTIDEQITVDPELRRIYANFIGIERLLHPANKLHPLLSLVRSLLFKWV
mmetsp:Transcript_13895/g.23129  ORF Transcript_13895/g.23129 Transcript_13895/m.23129 type:complete len:240 (-) Transcript_13895:282-1001(-)